MFACLFLRFTILAEKQRAKNCVANFWTELYCVIDLQRPCVEIQVFSEKAKKEVEVDSQYLRRTIYLLAVSSQNLFAFQLGLSSRARRAATRLIQECVELRVENRQQRSEIAMYTFLFVSELSGWFTFKIFCLTSSMMCNENAGAFVYRMTAWLLARSMTPVLFLLP